MPHLATGGRVGYDLAEAAHFHRELPYDPEAMEAMYPRLGDARALVDGGHVRLLDDLRAEVRSVGTTYLVRHSAEGDRCTCPWYAKHGTHRGPCEHLLAVRLARS